MTNKQKQHLLAYLDYYAGEIDGIFGPLSTQAAICFQQDFGLTADGVIGSETEQALRLAIAQGMPEKEVLSGSPSGQTFWNRIQFFTRGEFRCTCSGRGCSGFPAEPVEALVQNAESARKHFGRIADVSSGVRCKLRNSELPGSAANSLHMRGKAMDFRIRGISSRDLLEYVKGLPLVEEAYAIDESYVHMGVLKQEGAN